MRSTTVVCSVVDPKLFIPDPDPDPALNFRVPDPDPGKSDGSMRIRIRNTAEMHLEIFTFYTSKLKFLFHAKET